MLPASELIENEPQIFRATRRLPLLFNKSAKDQIDVIELVGRRFRTPREIAEARDHFLTRSDTWIESFGFTQVIANRPQRIRKRVQFALLRRRHLAQRVEQPAHRGLYDYPPVINAEITVIEPTCVEQAIENGHSPRPRIRQRRIWIIRPVDGSVLGERFGNKLERLSPAQFTRAIHAFPFQPVDAIYEERYTLRTRQR